MLLFCSAVGHPEHSSSKMEAQVCVLNFAVCFTVRNDVEDLFNVEYNFFIPVKVKAFITKVFYNWSSIDFIHFTDNITTCLLLLITKHKQLNSHIWNFMVCHLNSSYLIYSIVIWMYWYHLCIRQSTFQTRSKLWLLSSGMLSAKEWIFFCHLNTVLNAWPSFPPWFYKSSLGNFLIQSNYHVYHIFVHITCL